MKRQIFLFTTTTPIVWTNMKFNSFDEIILLATLKVSRSFSFSENTLSLTRQASVVNLTPVDASRYGSDVTLNLP